MLPSIAYISCEKYNTVYSFNISKYPFDTTLTNRLLLYGSREYCGHQKTSC